MNTPWVPVTSLGLLIKIYSINFIRMEARINLTFRSLPYSWMNQVTRMFLINSLKDLKAMDPDPLKAVAIKA